MSDNLKATKIRKAVLEELMEWFGFDSWWYFINDKIQKEIEGDLDDIILRILEEGVKVERQ